MDGAMRWPLGPVGAALATGAFFAFFLAYWKRRPKPQERDILEIPNVEDSLLTNEVGNLRTDSESLQTSRDVFQCHSEPDTFMTAELTESSKNQGVEPTAQNCQRNVEKQYAKTFKKNASMTTSSLLLRQDSQGSVEQDIFRSLNKPQPIRRSEETVELDEYTKNRNGNPSKQNEPSLLKKRYSEDSKEDIKLSFNPKLIFKPDYFPRTFQGFHLQNPNFFERSIQRSEAIRRGKTVSESNTFQNYPKLSVDIEIKTTSISAMQNIADRPITRAAIEICLRNVLLTLLSENKAACQDSENETQKVAGDHFSNSTENHDKVLEENYKMVVPSINSTVAGKSNLIEEGINTQCSPLTIKETKNLEKNKNSSTLIENIEESLVNDLCSETLESRKFEDDKYEVPNNGFLETFSNMENQVTTKCCEIDEINSNKVVKNSKTEQIFYKRKTKKTFDNCNVNVSKKVKMVEMCSPTPNEEKVLESEMECKTAKSEAKQIITHQQQSLVESNNDKNNRNRTDFSIKDDSVVEFKPLLSKEKSTVVGTNVEFIAISESTANVINKGGVSISLPEVSDGKQIETISHQQQSLLESHNEEASRNRRDFSVKDDLVFEINPLLSKEKSTVMEKNVEFIAESESTVNEISKGGVSISLPEVSDGKEIEKISHQQQSSLVDSHNEEVNRNRTDFSLKDFSVIEIKPLLSKEKSTVVEKNVEFIAGSESTANEINKGGAPISLPEVSDGKQIKTISHQQKSLVESHNEKANRNRRDFSMKDNSVFKINALLSKEKSTVVEKNVEFIAGSESTANEINIRGASISLSEVSDGKQIETASQQNQSLVESHNDEIKRNRTDFSIKDDSVVEIKPFLSKEKSTVVEKNANEINKGGVSISLSEVSNGKQIETSKQQIQSLVDSHNEEVNRNRTDFSLKDVSVEIKPLLSKENSTVVEKNVAFVTGSESTANEISKTVAPIFLPEVSDGKQIENEMEFHEKSNVVEVCQEDESSSSDITVIFEPILKKEKILNDEREEKISNSLLDFEAVNENRSAGSSFYVEDNLNLLSTFKEKSHPNSSKTIIDFTHSENSAKCQKGIENENKTSVNSKAGETKTTTEVADIRSVKGRKNANEINFRNARKKLDRIQKQRLEKFRVLFRRRKVSKQLKGENETHAGVLDAERAHKNNHNSGKIQIREKLADFQGKEFVSGEEKRAKDRKKGKLSLGVSLTLKLGIEKRSRVIAPDRDVRGIVTSRTRTAAADAERKQGKRQMDRRTGERRIETKVRTDGSVVSTAVVSRCSFDDHWDWDDSLTVRTVVSEETFRPTFEEFVSGADAAAMASDQQEKEEIQPDDADRDGVTADAGDDSQAGLLPAGLEPSSPRVQRLMGLLNRDEERRSKRRPAPEDQDGEWERILRDVLASVHELESWEGRRRADVKDAEEHPSAEHPQSDPGVDMEAEALSPPAKGETPTKVKSLRFKLDPDVFDVPSDDSFYDDEREESRSWRRPQQPRYKTFSSLDLGRSDEPVRLVSVQASVVPAGQKMVARPMGIDLRVRLTEERQSKRAHVGTSPSQAKRRSPVSDGWCQELSPVTENVDWRETFTSVEEPKVIIPNGILKTPSPKANPENSHKSDDSSFQIKNNKVEVSNNPFKSMTDDSKKSANENKDSVTTPVVQKPKVPWKPPHLERKPFSLPRKKFEPDPEAIERITGYKIALSKPPLPPPTFHKVSAVPMRISKAELARKQYLDSKAQLAKGGADGAKKFQQFLQQAQSDRARIGNSVPDLCAIEKAVVEQWAREKNSASSPRESPAREEDFKQNESISSRGSTPDDAWASYVQSCRRYFGRRSQSMSYLETDVDIVPNLEEVDKCYSVCALNEEVPSAPDDSDMDQSREDLDDSGRAKSEHELRVERSLRSLPLPDWYKRSDKPKSGFILSSSKEKRGWAAAKSLTSSTSSLASCGLRRPTTVRSLRSSREDIPWSSPDGPTLSLALAKAFREPYLGWRRARTPTSSGVSSSPRGASPPSSWGAATTTDEDEVLNGEVSFDGEDAFIGRTSSLSEDDNRKKIDPPSLDDTGADVATVSMDTGDPIKLPGGEDTCEDINNMSMDTCEMFDADDRVEDDAPSATADTGDDIDNLSTDTTDNKECKDISRDCYESTQSFSKECNDTTKDSKEILKDLRKNHIEKLKDFSKDDEDKSKNSHVCENNNSIDGSDIYSNDVSQNYSKDTTKNHNKDISQNYSNVISQNHSNDTSYSYSKNYNSKDTSNSSKVKDCMKDSKLKDSNKLKRYSYSQSIYHSEWDDEEESRGDRKGVRSASPSPDGHKVIWIESSFVGSRTTTSIVVLPQDNTSTQSGNVIERPASR